MPKDKTPITISGTGAEALLAVLSQAADFCAQHGADRDLVKRLKDDERNHLLDFGKSSRGRKIR